MNDSVNSAITQLNEYMSATGKSQSAISKELGISAGTLSQFLNSTYIGLNEDIAEKVHQFLEREHERSLYTANPKFKYDLENTELVFTGLSYVHSRGGIATIVGSAGSGKTTALQQYAKENNGVIYVQMDATKSSPRSVLKPISKAMGKDVRGSASDLLDTLIDEFKGTSRLVIIDEAQHLTERSFDTVRALNDKAGIGLVYSGTPDIRNRMVGRKKEELDQVYSRIVYDIKLKNRYKLSEIKSLFSDYNLDEDVLKGLHNISSRKGGLRLAINLFMLANDMAVQNGDVISLAYLNVASKHIGTGDGVGYDQ